MNGRLILVVSLWLKDANIAGFEAFERKAVRLMAKHGGRIERAMRADDQSRKLDDPFEVHVVSFPDEAAFLAYREDPDVRLLASERAEVISKSTILMGRDIETYA